MAKRKHRCKVRSPRATQQSIVCQGQSRHAIQGSTDATPLQATSSPYPLHEQRAYLTKRLFHPPFLSFILPSIVYTFLPYFNPSFLPLSFLTPCTYRPLPTTAIVQNACNITGNPPENTQIATTDGTRTSERRREARARPNRTHELAPKHYQTRSKS